MNTVLQYAALLVIMMLVSVLVAGVLLTLFGPRESGRRYSFTRWLKALLLSTPLVMVLFGVAMGIGFGYDGDDSVFLSPVTHEVNVPYDQSAGVGLAEVEVSVATPGCMRNVRVRPTRTVSGYVARVYDLSYGQSFTFQYCWGDETSSVRLLLAVFDDHQMPGQPSDDTPVEIVFEPEQGTEPALKTPVTFGAPEIYPVESVVGIGSGADLAWLVSIAEFDGGFVVPVISDVEIPVGSSLRLGGAVLVDEHEWFRTPIWPLARKSSRDGIVAEIESVKGPVAWTMELLAFGTSGAIDSTVEECTPSDSDDVGLGIGCTDRPPGQSRWSVSED